MKVIPPESWVDPGSYALLIDHLKLLDEPGTIQFPMRSPMNRDSQKSEMPVHLL